MDFTQLINLSAFSHDFKKALKVKIMILKISTGKKLPARYLKVVRILISMKSGLLSSACAQSKDLVHKYPSDLVIIELHSLLLLFCESATSALRIFRLSSGYKANNSQLGQIIKDCAVFDEEFEKLKNNRVER